VKASELKGRAILVLSQAAKVGHVDDILFDAPYRRVLGFRIKRGGLFGPREAMARERVSAIGRDALTVDQPDAINEEQRITELSGAASLDQIKGTKVVTAGGELVGVIDDVTLDDDGREVTSYTLSASLWDRMTHGNRELSARQVLRLGEGGIMIVPNAVAERIKAGEDA
jgi:uncharacterized protein YrrD